MVIKMNRLIYVLPHLIALIFFVQAQDYNSLVIQKERVIKETELLNQALLEAGKVKNYNINQLTIINKKIHLQQDLLNTYQKAIGQLILEQVAIEDTITIVSNYLEKMQKNYAKLIEFSHRSLRQYNQALFFLSSNNFNQLIRRIYHFNQLARQRRHKYQEIQITRDELFQKEQLLFSKKASQADLILSQKKQIKLLNKTKLNQEKAIRGLKDKTDSLIQVIKIKELETQKINKTILDLIERENTRKKNLDLTLSPNSSSFRSHKGDLPWPVKTGSIVSAFGKVAHPVLAGITLMNNGIEIATNNNIVRSVFDGEISKIIVLPTGFKVVIIRHGNYLTVYSNLKNTNIQKGQKVKKQEIIGTLYEEGNKKNNLLGFQIWNGREKLNPTHWISSD